MERKDASLNRRDPRSYKAIRSPLSTRHELHRSRVLPQSILRRLLCPQEWGSRSLQIPGRRLHRRCRHWFRWLHFLGRHRPCQLQMLVPVPSTSAAWAASDATSGPSPVS